MATLTLDKDLLAAVRDGRIDLNTADVLHKARRETVRKNKAISRRLREVNVLKRERDALIDAETAAFTVVSTE